MTETMSSNPCRICMGSKMNQISIFINDLSRKLTEIADVEVQEGDGLPPTICEDCELDLEKCFKFREQIQWADSKFRESLSVSEVVFEECQIKQEVGPMHTFMNDDNQDQIEDDDDDRGPSDNDEDYEMRDDPEDKTENAEKERNQVTHPLDHVEIIEHRTKQEIHIASTDQNSQEEPLIVAQNMKSENEPTSDPLMHTEPQSMDTDNNMPGPSTSASTVCGTEKSKSSAYWPTSSISHSEPGTSFGTMPANQLNLRQRKPTEPGLVDMQTSVNEFGHFMTQSHFAAAGPSTPNVPLDNLDESINTSEGVAEDKPLKEEPSPKRIRKRKESSSSGSCRESSSPKKRVVTKRVTRKKSLTTTKQKLVKAQKIEILFKANDETNCFVCNVNLYDHELLLEHFNNKQFYCRVCTKEFDNHSNLLTHFTSHRAYNCKNCSGIFFCKKDYLDHKKNSETCSSSLVKCEICEAVMEKRSLRGHKLQTHFGNTGAFKCIVCTKSFSLAHMLTDHLKKVHIAYEYMECSHCHKFILGPEKLKHHVRMNHVQSTEGSSSFICPICSKVFTRENILKIHLNKHNDNTESLCEDCGKSIVGKAAMKEHKRYEHSKGEMFVCCHQTFNSYKSFRNHQRSHYRDSKREQPAFCDLCGKQFKNASILKQHIQIHSDERAYKCEICGATFKQKVALYTHSRIHSETNKYTCEMCGQTFRWKQTFDKHVKKCGMPHPHHHHHYCSGTSDYLNL